MDKSAGVLDYNKSNSKKYWVSSVQITSLCPAVTQAELQVFEHELGAEFPKDYLDFLLVHNGAKVKPNCFVWNNKGHRNYNIVRYLFGLCELEWCSLRAYQKDYSSRMPANLLPIGTDEDSSNICLSISGDDYGKVYFWDRHFEVLDGIPDNSNLFLLADSFTEFIDSLKNCEDL
jgi:hypothetical protein